GFQRFCRRPQKPGKIRLSDLERTGIRRGSQAYSTRRRRRSPGTPPITRMDTAILDYAVVAMLGALVGGAELVSRYRDAPARAVFNLPAAIYIALNVVASLAALIIIRIYGWTFGISSGAAAVRWGQVGCAGTAAMALFRTSLFTVHAGDRDIG